MNPVSIRASSDFLPLFLAGMAVNFEIAAIAIALGLLLGILLVVVGIQFFSLGLVGELLTSHHEEKAQGSDTVRTYVREVLR